MIIKISIDRRENNAVDLCPLGGPYILVIEKIQSSINQIHLQPLEAYNFKTNMANKYCLLAIEQALFTSEYPAYHISFPLSSDPCKSGRECEIPVVKHTMDVVKVRRNGSGKLLDYF